MGSSHSHNTLVQRVQEAAEAGEVALPLTADRRARLQRWMGSAGTAQGNANRLARAVAAWPGQVAPFPLTIAEHRRLGRAQAGDGADTHFFIAPSASAPGEFCLHEGPRPEGQVFRGRKVRLAHSVVEAGSAEGRAEALRHLRKLHRMQAPGEC